jgi:hypothetical protein
METLWTSAKAIHKYRKIQEEVQETRSYLSDVFNFSLSDRIFLAGVFISLSTTSRENQEFTLTSPYPLVL